MFRTGRKRSRATPSIHTEDRVKINLSDVILVECLKRIEEFRKNYVGFAFITLTSTKEGYSLHLRNGFENLEDDMNFAIADSDMECIPMYLPMDME